MLAAPLPMTASMVASASPSDVAAHPDAGLRALLAMSHRMATPPHTPEQILTELQDRYGMDEAAALLRPRLSEVG